MQPSTPATHPTTAALPGLLLTGLIAAVAMAGGTLPTLQGWGLSALTLAILLGIVLGNTLFPRFAHHAAVGVDFSRSRLLRIGIVLYGFRVTLHDIAGVGVAGVLIDAVMVASVFSLAVWLGTRVLRLDLETSILIGAGSAICGAAAVMATEPVLRAPAHKVSVAVATVVVFGTLAMLPYPPMYPLPGFTPPAHGLLARPTLPQIAQVVVAGHAVGDGAANTAVIEKLLRVMMLAPFLFVLSALRRRTSAADGERARIVVPWFAVAFIVVSAFNSLQLLPTAWTQNLLRLDTALLAMAMAGLGLRTHAGAIRQAGARPLLLATMLFAFLIGGGWAVNAGVTHALALCSR